MTRLIVFLALMLSTTISWAQKGITFTYELEKDKSDGDIVHVAAKIMNDSTDDICFLSESCNGLDYYLTTTSDSTEILILIHCNATFPRKIELKANSSFEFETNVRISGEKEDVGLNLNLVTLNKSVEVEGKFISEIRKANIENTLVLEGYQKK